MAEEKKGAPRELWDEVLQRSGLDPARVTEYNVQDDVGLDAASEEILRSAENAVRAAIQQLKNPVAVSRARAALAALQGETNS